LAKSTISIHSPSRRFEEIAMNRRYTATALVLLIGSSLSVFATGATAAPPAKALLLTPVSPGEPYGLPKFGFSSSTIYGYGERVVFVRPGGRAWQLGLEPGDVILSMNGYRLTYPGSWNDALSRTLADGGLVQLRVRDVRTGNAYLRSIYIGYDGGPVAHYYKTGAIVSNNR
jgi:membrane-associated protease RseP (regulator of RpoE activity)